MRTKNGLNDDDEYLRNLRERLGHLKHWGPEGYRKRFLVDGQGHPSKGHKGRERNFLNNGQLELIVMGCLAAGAAVGVAAGLPPIMKAAEFFIGSGLEEVLTANPIMSIGCKFVILAGLCLGMWALVTSRPRIWKTILIAGLAAVLYAAIPASMGMISQALVQAIGAGAWGLINGVQIYVLTQKLTNQTGKDKNWFILGSGSVLAYFFEVALHMGFNENFQPLRNLVVSGDILWWFLDGLIIRKLTDAIRSLFGMCTAVLLFEVVIILMFALWQRRKQRLNEGTRGYRHE
jgi:hypothetical protein